MSKRNAYLILGCVVALALVLLLPSFTARAVTACFILVVAAVLLGRVFLTKTSTAEFQLRSVDAQPSDEEPAQEIFALGKLFEATMNGMREGLVVVDRDMRVVASNTAAHRLFNLPRGKLDAQRLTQLTRNPAIY
ncbi:MAG: hypothetical protein ACREA9_01225, partial [Pyrinomonadaceae bacterium]